MVHPDAATTHIEVLQGPAKLVCTFCKEAQAHVYSMRPEALTKQESTQDGRTGG